jgi:hypothetical protein
LTSITITPPDSSIAKGTQVQLTAAGNFSDGTTQDLTTQVSWISGADTIAHVSDVPGTQGLVTGLGAGTASITATLNGIGGSTTVTLTAATLTSITIAPPDPSIANGTTVQLTATGNFSDGTTQDLTTQVSWTSGDNTIAEVGDLPDSQGLVTGVAVGNTSITATLGGIQGSTTVTVTMATLTSITVEPTNPSVPKGSELQLTANCSFSDNTTQNCTSQASWVSLQHERGSQRRPREERGGHGQCHRVVLDNGHPRRHQRLDHGDGRPDNGGVRLSNRRYGQYGLSLFSRS